MLVVEVGGESSRMAKEDDYDDYIIRGNEWFIVRTHESFQRKKEL